MLPVLSPDCLELLIPLVTSLLQSPHKAMFSSLLLLDKISSILGADRTKESFLDPVTSLYLNCSPTVKHAKLFYRSFLLALIVQAENISRFYQLLSAVSWWVQGLRVGYRDAETGPVHQDR